MVRGERSKEKENHEPRLHKSVWHVQLPANSVLCHLGRQVTCYFQEESVRRRRCKGRLRADCEAGFFPEAEGSH